MFADLFLFFLFFTRRAQQTLDTRQRFKVFYAEKRNASSRYVLALVFVAFVEEFTYLKPILWLHNLRRGIVVAS